METLYKDVINILFDKSEKAFIDCDRGRFFWKDMEIDDDDAPFSIVNEKDGININTFFTLEILSTDMAMYVARTNRRNTLLLEDIKEEALADLESRSIFCYPEIVEWIAQYGREKEASDSMVYILSLESLRVALISFLKQTEIETKIEE